jgi:hypothetical protein
MPVTCSDHVEHLGGRQGVGVFDLPQRGASPLDIEGASDALLLVELEVVEDVVGQVATGADDFHCERRARHSPSLSVDEASGCAVPGRNGASEPVRR